MRAAIHQYMKENMDTELIGNSSFLNFEKTYHAKLQQILKTTQIMFQKVAMGIFALKMRT